VNNEDVLGLGDVGIELQLCSDGHLLARDQPFVSVFNGQFDLLEGGVGDSGVVDKSPFEVVVGGHGILLTLVALEVIISSITIVIGPSVNLIMLRPFHKPTSLVL